MPAVPPWIRHEKYYGICIEVSKNSRFFECTFVDCHFQGYGGTFLDCQFIEQEVKMEMTYKTLYVNCLFEKD